MMKRMLPVLLASLAGLAILLTLGFWQLDRLHWKNDLIEAAKSREGQIYQLQDVDFAKPDVSDIAYSHVVLKGRFMAQNLFAFYTLSKPQNGPYGGQGYMVFSPFILEGDERVILVNRGFIPISEKPNFDIATLAEDTVEIEGIVKKTEERSVFSPPHDLQKRIFYTRDVQAMLAEVPLGPRVAASFYVDAKQSEPEGLPQGGETVVSFTNNHLQYAVTWFGLALTLIGVAGAFLLKIWREERAKTV